jgi:hypothetical protein
MAGLLEYLIYGQLMLETSLMPEACSGYTVLYGEIPVLSPAQYAIHWNTFSHLSIYIYCDSICSHGNTAVEALPYTLYELLHALLYLKVS